MPRRRKGMIVKGARGVHAIKSTKRPSGKRTKEGRWKSGAK